MKRKRKDLSFDDIVIIGMCKRDDDRVRALRDELETLRKSDKLAPKDKKLLKDTIQILWDDDIYIIALEYLIKSKETFNYLDALAREQGYKGWFDLINPRK